MELECRLFLSENGFSARILFFVFVDFRCFWSFWYQQDHPNVIRLYEVFEDKKFVYLVMELCEGGELFERLIKKVTLSEDEARSFFHQLLKALNYLHSKKVCHRDLKPENLMFVKPGDNLMKIIDFGISKTFYDSLNVNNVIRLTSFAGILLFLLFFINHAGNKR